MATNSKSKSSLFEREMQIDGRAVGIVIGKRRNTIKSFEELPGIVSVKFISHGKLHILGKSQQALDTVVSAVEQRVSFFFEKNGGYSPDFFTFCFCKSVEHPLLAVDKVCFEEFPSNISNLSAQEAAPEKTFFCVKSAELRENSTATAQDEVDILSAELADKTSKVFMKSHWDLSAYKAQLQSCLEPLFETQSTRPVKIFISFGKAIFHGANWSELLHGGFMPVDRLRDLCRRELLDHRFSTACSDSAVKDLKLLHLQTLGYRKMSSRKKITIHVADLQSGQLQFNVSVHCESCEGLGEWIAIRRERNKPKWHGFVTFCCEGFGKTDFRVGVMTHATDLYPDREMVEWIRKAWRNRTLDGLLVFNPPGRFLVTNIWYKDSDNYVTVDWKFRIAEFRQANRSNRLSNKWDCSLSSRWIKRNVDKIGKDNMNLAMENLAELVNEAAKISSLMDVN